MTTLRAAAAGRIHDLGLGRALAVAACAGLLGVFASTIAMASSHVIGTLRLDVVDGEQFNYPMDGVKLRAVLTNNGTAPVFTGFMSAKIKETGTPLLVLPLPRNLEPGQSMTFSVFADLGLGSLAPGVPTAQTLVWQLGPSGSVEVPYTVTNWSAGGGSVLTPTGGQAIAVSVKVADSGGNPITNGGVFARAGSSIVNFSQVGTTGTYTGTLPPSGNWVVSAEAPGRKFGYLVLDSPTKYSGQTLTLAPQTVSFTYQPAVALESGIGPWMGRVNGAEDAILITNAMEIWADSIKPAITSAKVRLYGTDGTKRWEFPTGYEVKAGDLSADGKWVVAATLDAGNSSSGMSGPSPGILFLIDAATGQQVWSQPLDAAFMQSATHGSIVPPSGFVPAVREVRLSPDGTIVAAGDQYGDLVLRRRADPSQLVMKANLSGDLRAIRFSADSARVFAAFGSGLTAAYRVSDGVELWRRETYSWVHPEGFVLSPDGTRLGVMAQGGDVVMLDAATGTVLWQRDTKSLSWWASFSGDGTVFLAGTQTGGTLGLKASDGTHLYTLPGGKGGGFGKGASHFILGNQALHHQDGSRLSNFLSGMEATKFGNWQVSWVSADGLSLFLAEQQSDSVTMPVVYSVKGQSSGTPTQNPVRLTNISTRGQVLTGNDVMIGGFVVGGSAPKKVLITARGPSLAAFGVTGALTNPKLELYSGQAVIASNDDWRLNGPNVVSDIEATGIFPDGLAPSDPREAALMMTLNPGAYTAVVSGVGGTGVGIVEVFERDKPEAPLVNISTRGQVQTGVNVMIGGFTIQGDAPRTVLITARGPSLAAYGIANPLANPKLEIYAGQVKIHENDDWQVQNAAAGGAASMSAILATGVFPNGLAPSNPNEAALLLTLPPGAYTAIVSGADGGTGVGIVEVFAR